MYPHTQLYKKKVSQLTFMQHFNTDMMGNTKINLKSIYIHPVTKVSPIQPPYNRVSQKYLFPASVHWEIELLGCSQRNEYFLKFPFIVTLKFLCICNTKLKLQKLLNKGKNIVIHITRKILN